MSNYRKIAPIDCFDNWVPDRKCLKDNFNLLTEQDATSQSNLDVIHVLDDRNAKYPNQCIVLHSEIVVFHVSRN